MIKSKNPISIRNFVNSNGFLRFILFVFTAVCLGLAAGDYDETSPGDIYFLLIIIFAFILAFFAFLLSFIDTPHFKIQKHRQIDSTLHLYAAWFIFNASIAKLVRGTQIQSESRQAIQTAAGIFGFLISPLYAWLAYLTFVDKRSCIICHCLSNEVDEVDDEGKMQTIKSRQMLVKSSKSSLHWDWKKLLMFSSISERLQWSTIFDGQTRGKQYRLFSFILGFSTVILAGVSYRYPLRSEEYFMIVICINFFITLLFHLFYTLGISRIEKLEKDLWIFDKSFHLTGGIFLFVAGNLFLASNFTSNVDTLTPQRTLAAVLGILNGVLYFYIGLSIQGNEGKTLVQNSTENEEKNFINMTSHGRKQGENGEVMSSKQANNKFASQSKPALIFDPAKV